MQVHVSMLWKGAPYNLPIRVDLRMEDIADKLDHRVFVRESAESSSTVENTETTLTESEPAKSS